MKIKKIRHSEHFRFIWIKMYAFLGFLLIIKSNTKLLYFYFYFLSFQWRIKSEFWTTNVLAWSHHQVTNWPFNQLFINIKLEPTPNKHKHKHNWEIALVNDVGRTPRCINKNKLFNFISPKEVPYNWERKVEIIRLHFSIWHSPIPEDVFSLSGPQTHRAPVDRG